MSAFGVRIVRALACLAGSALVAGCAGGSPSGTPAPERPLGALAAPEPAGPQEVWVVGDDAQTMTSRWFLALDGASVTLSLTSDLDGRTPRGAPSATTAPSMSSTP